MFYKLTYKYSIPQLQYQVWFQITKEELRTITLTAGNILTTLAVYKVCTELTGLFSGTCTTFCCHPQKQPPFQGYRLDRPMAPFQEVGSLHSCSTQIAENFSEMHLHSLCQSKGKNVIQLSKTINYIFAFVCFVSNFSNPRRMQMTILCGMVFSLLQFFPIAMTVFPIPLTSFLNS